MKYRPGHAWGPGASGFHCVAKTSVELLYSNDPPDSASQVASGIGTTLPS